MFQFCGFLIFSIPLAVGGGLLTVANQGNLSLVFIASVKEKQTLCIKEYARSHLFTSEERAFEIDTEYSLV